MSKQYYIRADIVDTSEELEQLQLALNDVSSRSGIQHNMEILDRGTSQILLLSVDHALYVSGEYQRRMDDMAKAILLKVFDTIEEAAIGELMNSAEGQAAARQAENFLRGLQH